jgi:hypothetical protein
MSDTVSWTAVALSIASASIATVAAWTNREKLRLDLYDRRFSIYVRAADLRYQLTSWDPTKELHPKLKEALECFRTASMEGQFLFSQQSGVQELLEKLSEDAFHIVNWSGFLALAGPMNSQDQSRLEKERSQRMLRIITSLEPLRERMAPFLNFHSYSALPRLFEDDCTDGSS